MWTIYTRALARAPSAIQANVLNTAANFVCAALAGVALFGEKLDRLWWIGASLLIAGTVIIGKRNSEGNTGDEVEAKNSIDKKTN
jgi:drug/metabolite transporter (DMT)-like permease